ncbi:MAG: hypothetical protein EAZ09_06945 [Oscillatoriales cyanobacterium]|nr:MAG: hypothetical protein EAZ18_05605 [Oscillatoriales cyanobacterium]TAH23574.1 MAG: hypothetical protein EAZ09_06945 [Oscillatoriales cyanobacterium]
MSGWAIGRLLTVWMSAVDTWHRMLDRKTIIRHSLDQNKLMQVLAAKSYTDYQNNTYWVKGTRTIRDNVNVAFD